MPGVDLIRDFLRTRRQRYHQTFLHTGEAGRAVLADLSKFCRATETCFHPGDERLTYILEGRREVWLRIQQQLNLSDQELWDLQRVTKENPGAGRNGAPG